MSRRKKSDHPLHHATSWQNAAALLQARNTVASANKNAPVYYRLAFLEEDVQHLEPPPEVLRDDRGSLRGSMMEDDMEKRDGT